ncbi:hypothetical protein LZ30DRAFT_604159 [Colletotrichum cereale]|nr:hypothetical protein LZ30DRAFT_604159 [Colletotrichum cereale]
MLNPNAVSELLVLRCQPWKEIVYTTAADIIFIVRSCVESILDHVLQTRRVKEASITVEKALETVIKDFRDKVDELMGPYCSIHPLVYNHNVVQHVWSIQRSRQKDRIEAQKSAGRKNTADYLKGTRTADCNEPPTTWDDAETNLHRQAYELASDYTNAYYKNAMQGLISNLGLYAVEGCLLSKLTTISEVKHASGAFDELIHGMDDEPTNATCRSRHIQSEHDVTLKTVVETLRRVEAHQAASSVAESTATTEGRSPPDFHVNPELTFSISRYMHTIN